MRVPDLNYVQGASVVRFIIAYLLTPGKDVAWSLPMASYMVIIMGVQYFEGREHRYVDYPVTDVLKMMGKACHPTEDDRSRCVLMCQQTLKDF